MASPRVNADLAFISIEKEDFIAENSLAMPIDLLYITRKLSLKGRNMGRQHHGIAGSSLGR